MKGLVIKEKVILVVGATGCGKSTWIDALLNHVLGVEYEDGFRFRLVDAYEGTRNQASGITQDITIYTLHYMEGMAVDFTLTIIDTPGFGGTNGIEGDKKIVQQVRNIFHGRNGGIDHLDCVGFVIQSSAVRLTQTQKYIFDSILALFGRDIIENISLLFTFADAAKPKVLSAVQEAGVPYQNFFKFNNSAFFDDVNDPNAGQNNDLSDEDIPDVDSFKQLFWKIGMKQFAKFFAFLKNTCAKSLVLTKDVLHEKEHLERHVEQLRQHVTQAIEVLEKLHGEENMLQTALEDKESNKDCTVRKVTIDDVTKRYERATGQTLNMEHVIKKVRDDIDSVEAQMKSNLSEITVSFERLNQIAMRTNLSQIDFLDVLIQSEKYRGNPDWKKRVQRLQIFRDKAQAMYAIAQGQHGPLGEYGQ